MDLIDAGALPMPRVQLAVKRDHGVRFDDRINTAVDVEAYRIYAELEFGQPPMRLRAVIDTGAPISILSKIAWQPLASLGLIRWLSYSPALVPTSELKTVPLLAKQYPFRIGVIPAVLCDASPGAGRLARVDVLVQCLEDWPPTPAAPGLFEYPIVLGLRSGVLEGRYLVFGTDRRTGVPEAWVQEERPD
jgi:hypothetical protein